MAGNEVWCCCWFIEWLMIFTRWWHTAVSSRDHSCLFPLKLVHWRHVSTRKFMKGMMQFFVSFFVCKYYKVNKTLRKQLLIYILIYLIWLRFYCCRDAYELLVRSGRVSGQNWACSTEKVLPYKWTSNIEHTMWKYVFHWSQFYVWPRYRWVRLGFVWLGPFHWFS